MCDFSTPRSPVHYARMNKRSLNKRHRSHGGRQVGPTLSVCLALNVLFELFEIWTNAHPEIPNHTLLVLPQSVQKKKREIQIQMKPLPLTSPVILSPFCPLTQTRWGPARSSTRGRFPAVAERMDGWDGSTIQTCPFPSTRCGDKQMGICFFSSSVFFLNKERERTVEGWTEHSIHAAFCCCFALFPCSKYIDEWWPLSWSSLNCTVTKESSPPHHPPSHTWGIQISKFKNRSRSINWPQGTKVKS